MKTQAHHPEDPARSARVVDSSLGVIAPAGKADSRSPSLRLVSGRKLVLAQPCPNDAPEGWQSGISRLARWLDLDVAYIPQRAESGLKKVTAWATSAATAPIARAPAPPLYAPWRCWSPVSLPETGSAMAPRADWIASYLYDHGAGRPNRQGSVDIQLLSHLSDMTSSGSDTDGPMPRQRVLQSMIHAAQAQGRTKIAIVTDVRRRNAIVRQLLQMDRSITRGASQIDVLLIENALCEVVRKRGSWDAIIVLPDLRSLMFAMLAQVHQAKGPWPMVWHHRGGSTICAEILEETTDPISLDAPLLVQTLSLAASHAGLNLCARRLVQGASRLWHRGIVTQGHGSLAPYVTEISSAEFIEEMCKAVAGSQRTVARWRAIPGDTATHVCARPMRLSVVGAD